MNENQQKNCMLPITCVRFIDKKFIYGLKSYKFRRKEYER